MLIGLSGFATAGKNALGNFLVQDHGFKQYAFADALRAVVYALNPAIVTMEGSAAHNEGAQYEGTLQEIVDDVGWDRAKTENAEVRRLLQAMGTEAGRKILGENIWIDAIFNQIHLTDNVVLTDVRFPNEAQRIKEEGGLVVRINRPGVTALNAHPSETALSEWPFDYTIPNEGSLDVLREMTHTFVYDWNVLITNWDRQSSNPLPGYGAPTPRNAWNHPVGTVA